MELAVWLALFFLCVLGYGLSYLLTMPKAQRWPAGNGVARQTAPAAPPAPPNPELDRVVRHSERRTVAGTVTLTQFELPAGPGNKELAKLRVKGGAKVWQFAAAGMSHDSTSGPAPRWQLYSRLSPGQALRFVRNPVEQDPNGVLLVPEDGELKGVDVGWIPRDIAAEIGPLLDAGAGFAVHVQKVWMGELTLYPRMYVYARLALPPAEQSQTIQ